MDDYQDDGNWNDREDGGSNVHTNKNNVIPLWGNEKTMNLNPLILTNIQSSHYFKVNLYELKTYHEVIDEIYYKVAHLEPWEKGSRKTAGQTGMCGGVRGVGAGGIVSTAFCLLYKLFTLKLTRKQVIGLITHPDSPYIRVLGFMYIRYTQPPADLWDWYEPYLDDTEELDVRAGGGQIMTIGNILKNFLCKLEWFSTLFPRIPVPIQQKLEKKMNERYPPPTPAAAATAAAATAAARKPGFSSRGNSRSRGETSNSRECRDRERSQYSHPRERGSGDQRKSSDRYGERSPYSRNGRRSSSRARFEERDHRRSLERDQERKRHRYSSERSMKEDRHRREYDEKDKYRDEYSRKERKHRGNEHVHEKSHRRSESPDHRRSHHKEDGKGYSKYSEEEYAHYKSDKRRNSEERYRRKEDTNIKRSKYYD